MGISSIASLLIASSDAQAPLGAPQSADATAGFGAMLDGNATQVAIPVPVVAAPNLSGLTITPDNHIPTALVAGALDEAFDSDTALEVEFTALVADAPTRLVQQMVGASDDEKEAGEAPNLPKDPTEDPQALSLIALPLITQPAAQPQPVVGDLGMQSEAGVAANVTQNQPVQDAPFLPLPSLTPQSQNDADVAEIPVDGASSSQPTHVTQTQQPEQTQAILQAMQVDDAASEVPVVVLPVARGVSRESSSLKSARDAKSSAEANALITDDNTAKPTADGKLIQPQAAHGSVAGSAPVETLNAAEENAVVPINTQQASAQRGQAVQPQLQGAHENKEPAFLRLVQASHFTPAADQIAVRVRQGIEQGSTKIHIQLDPADLGRVDISMNVGSDGKANVTVTAEHKQTLDALVRDARALERALADAGVKADAGSMQFNLRGEQQARQDHQQSGAYSGAGAYANQTTQDDIMIAAPIYYEVIEDNAIDIRA